MEIYWSAQDWIWGLLLIVLTIAIHAASSGSPITPVEARKISIACAPIALAASAAVSLSPPLYK